jgi:hypothetical protein
LPTTGQGQTRQLPSAKNTDDGGGKIWSSTRGEKRAYLLLNITNATAQQSPQRAVTFTAKRFQLELQNFSGIKRGWFAAQAMTNDKSKMEEGK